jgi:hypothetical protein
MISPYLFRFKKNFDRNSLDDELYPCILDENGALLRSSKQFTCFITTHTVYVVLVQQLVHKLMSSQVWYELVDSATGLPYKGTRAAMLTFCYSDHVFLFKKAVKAENPNILSTVDASQLVVYKDRAAFDGKQEPLEEDSLVEGLGKLLKEAIIVAVPSSIHIDLETAHVQKKSKGDFFDQPLMTIRSDGFSENIPDFLYRDALVEKLWRFLSYSQFVIMSSSPGTGKNITSQASSHKIWFSILL